MSADIYLTEISKLIDKIHTTQMGNIQKAAKAMAASIAAGRAVHAFGSGHSVIAVMDLFPRYGAYPGFHPIMDPRLMWFNIVGPGGARELLWLEREEGYVRNVLLSHNLDPRDSILVFSHGGMNAAPIEVALQAKEAGLTVIAVTSVANRALNEPKHSSGKSLHDAADIVIDNCSPPEDALVPIDGLLGKVAASSTVTAVTITMSLLAETTAELARLGKLPERVFVSPNVPGVEKTNNEQVFVDYTRFQNSL
ncbi:MAG: sugar isomerase domain-containing protein [Anaerolineae bacterium]|nr:sugar isomerase domain-containing protein [Anaerolineae bacterium]